MRFAAAIRDSHDSFSSKNLGVKVDAYILYMLLYVYKSVYAFVSFVYEYAQSREIFNATELHLYFYKKWNIKNNCENL